MSNLPEPLQAARQQGLLAREGHQRSLDIAQGTTTPYPDDEFSLLTAQVKELRLAFARLEYSNSLIIQHLIECAVMEEK